ncbi:hypothetical protein F511_27883 [Dorcoceras hygrometricum]|uniref:Uncharacterized protein n=1 Tax=Dorcoceras hygrometricum TaxID=472368 RepID=A0A2Z7BP28_9LAMI|nr:hypothetical protein F511_27883 [Dorcoceras hygrometricum]
MSTLKAVKSAQFVPSSLKYLNRVLKSRCNLRPNQPDLPWLGKTRQRLPGTESVPETLKEYNATKIAQNNGGVRRQSTEKCYGEQCSRVREKGRQSGENIAKNSFQRKSQATDSNGNSTQLLMKEGPSTISADAKTKTQQIPQQLEAHASNRNSKQRALTKMLLLILVTNTNVEVHVSIAAARNHLLKNAQQSENDRSDISRNPRTPAASRSLPQVVLQPKKVAIERETLKEYNATKIAQNNGGVRRQSTEKCYGEQCSRVERKVDSREKILLTTDSNGNSTQLLMKEGPSTISADAKTKTQQIPQQFEAHASNRNSKQRALTKMLLLILVTNTNVEVHVSIAAASQHNATPKRRRFTKVHDHSRKRPGTQISPKTTAFTSKR